MIRKLLYTLIAFIASSYCAIATVWFVKVDAGSGTTGRSWPQAMNLADFGTRLNDGTIADGDKVCFAGGIYRMTSTQPFIIKDMSVTLQGGYAPDLKVTQQPVIDYPTTTPTIFTGDINCDGKPSEGDARNIFYIDNTSSPSMPRNIHIEGFTFSGCYYDGVNAYEAGAVVAELTKGVTVSHCIFENNKCVNGGGAGSTASGSAVLYTDCIFKGNEAGDAGAALRSARRSATIDGNKEAFDPVVVVNRCLITENRLTKTPEYPDGNAPEILYNGIVLPSTWPPKNMDPRSYEPMAVPYLKPENIPAVIPINVGRQLFVDDFLVDNIDGDIERIYYLAKKYEKNPILKAETDLEINIKGIPGAAPKDGGVYWDQKKGVWRMWYEAGWLNAMAYAESKDGITWLRQSLGIGKENQIITGYVPNSCGVVVDYDAPEYERYKIYFRPPNANAVSNMYGYAAISADGINWNNIVMTGPSGDRSTMFYNPFRKKYVYSLRNGGGIGLAPHGRNRFYRECSNFLAGASWTARNVVYWCGADNLDEPDPQVGINPELYNVNAIAYESLMLGVHQIFLGPENDNCKALGIPKRTDLKLAYSRDGFHWSRPDRRSFIPSSGGNYWDKGYVQSVGGICSVVGDELRFYYIGFRGDETQPGTSYGMHSNGSTGIATLRRDGFCSLTSATSGSVTTRPVKYDGSFLFVNADCTNGRMTVEILDEAGNVIEGFSASECEVMQGENSTIKNLSFDGGDLSPYKGRPVRFRFNLENASLYSFWVSGSLKGESNGYVAGGGPGYATHVDREGLDAYEQAKTYILP